MHLTTFRKAIFPFLISIVFTFTAKAQIKLPLGNVLNLNTSIDFLYWETKISFNTGIYKSDDYCFRKIYDSLDSRWLLSACFNGNCSNDLLQTGCFIRDFGFNDTTCFMAFHVQTNSYNGSSVIKYNVYNKNDSADKADLIFNITYKNATGVRDINFLKEIIIYPNPVTSDLTFRGDIDLPNADVQILNSLGQTVMNNNFSKSDNGSINVSRLVNGIYFLKIIPIGSGSDDKFFTQKFIKQ